MAETSGTAICGANDGFPPVRACFCDVDGLLIDTEDIYSNVRNSILHDYGKPDLPWSLVARMQCLKGTEVAMLAIEHSQIPLTVPEFRKVKSEREQIAFKSSKPLPGVEELLRNLQHLPLAMVTSTTPELLAVKTGHLEDMFSVFPKAYRVIGEDHRMGKGRGKPAPDCYLLALKLINESLSSSTAPIKPEECLVFEDSIFGAVAGRRAGMRVVWVPHKMLLSEFQGHEHKIIETSIRESLAKDGNNSRSSAMMDLASNRNWLRLLPSLENFPYLEYGIIVPPSQVGRTAQGLAHF